MGLSPSCSCPGSWTLWPSPSALWVSTYCSYFQFHVSRFFQSSNVFLCRWLSLNCHRRLKHFLLCSCSLSWFFSAFGKPYVSCEMLESATRHRLVSESDPGQGRLETLSQSPRAEGHRDPACPLLTQYFSQLPSMAQWFLPHLSSPFTPKPIQTCLPLPYFFCSNLPSCFSLQCQPTHKTSSSHIPIFCEKSVTAMSRGWSPQWQLKAIQTKGYKWYTDVHSLFLWCWKDPFTILSLNFFIYKMEIKNPSSQYFWEDEII